MLIASSEILGVLFPFNTNLSLVRQPAKLAKWLPFFLESIKPRLALSFSYLMSMVVTQIVGYLSIIPFEGFELVPFFGHFKGNISINEALVHYGSPFKLISHFLHHNLVHLITPRQLKENAFVRYVNQSISPLPQSCWWTLLDYSSQQMSQWCSRMCS